MNTIKLYYKSDFKVMLASETGWTGLPFRIRFWAASPSRNVEISYDGTTFKGCTLLDDGRLQIAFDDHNMGIGKLMMDIKFYISDDDYASGICDDYITPHSPVFVDDDDEEYEVVLAIDGAKQLTTVGTLPAYYMKGPKGDKGDSGAAGGTAAQITFDPATDTTAGSVGAALNDLNAAVFPLTVGWASGNDGTYEVGTSVTPTATATATRKGADVSSSATMTCTSGTVSGLTATAAAQTSGSLSMKATITQGGQTKQTDTKNWAWSNYRYRGVLNSVPADYKATIEAMTSTELTTTATLGSTALASGKYYLFAVKGTPTLVCRHASTDGVIGGCVKGTATIARKNGTGSDTYSYILIPASTQSWNFKITNA